jgi:DNA-cytosine methyltransferase
MMVKQMRHGSLFSGIGGFDLAAQWMGWDNVFHCEINKFCQKVLKKHFNSISYEDITTTDFSIHRGEIDIITGGVPCQPFSKAGKMQGKKDSRYLWDEYIRCVRECQPQWFVAENVSGLLSTDSGVAYENIILSMEAEGYETFTLCLPACSVGTYHIRERVWIIGRYFMETDSYTTRRKLGEIPNESKEKRSQTSSNLSGEFFGLHWYEAISRIHRVHNGVSRKLDSNRNASLGNAIVPQVAFNIFKTINRLEHGNL